MEVYFIRHGQTLANKTSRHQIDTEPLNIVGQRQAAMVARELAVCSPTRIISSPTLRAKQTADAIALELSLPVEESELFEELGRPAWVRGKRHVGAASVWFVWRWFFTKNETYWYTTQGESKVAFMARIEKARQHLEALPDDSRVVVVTHGVFISFFIDRICAGRALTWWQSLLRIARVRTLDNTSITHLQHFPDFGAEVCSWEVVRYDGDTHVRY